MIRRNAEKVSLNLFGISGVGLAGWIEARKFALPVSPTEKPTLSNSLKK